MKQIEFNEEFVKFVGRTKLIDEVLWLALSGAGVSFSFTGSKLCVTLMGSDAAGIKENELNYARMAIYVDGERIIDDNLDEPTKTYVVLDGERKEKAEIQIIKLSESAMSTAGIVSIMTDDEGNVEPLPRKKHSMEFIGDSITCGYGVDDLDLTHTFITGTEDVTKAYAYKVACELDAEYSMFSASGYGIISGYTDNPDARNVAERIPPYYESLGFSRDMFGSAGKPENIPWDFGQYQPEVVVINLGTNDDSFCQEDNVKQEEYATEYAKFLKVVRKSNPGAEIFCVLGLMGDRLYPWMCRAVEAYTEETGDAAIHTVRIPEQDSNKGYAIDYHPTPDSHTMGAKVVAEAIRKQMNW